MVVNVNVEKKIIEVQSEFTMNELAEFIALYVGTDWTLKLNPNNAAKEEKKEEKEGKKEFHYHYHYEYPYRLPYTYSWPYNFINCGGTVTAGIPINETVSRSGYCGTTTEDSGGILTTTNISSFYNSGGEISLTSGTCTKK